MSRYLFDSHCHLDFDAFADDRDGLWQRCREIGIETLLIPAVSPANCSQLFAVTEALPGVWGSAGLHPWWVGDWPVEQSLRDALVPWLSRADCLAVGECGLDALIDVPLDRQLPIFEKQLQVACDFQLPVIVHCRKAHNDVLPLLKKCRPPTGGVIHGFSGSTELAKHYWQQGFYIGIGGTITYPRAGKTRRAATELPLEALVLETDAPDMPLNGRQGKVNSPEYLMDVAECLAKLRGVAVDVIAEQTAYNSRQLFQLD